MKRIQIKLVATALIIGMSMLSIFAQGRWGNGNQNGNRHQNGDSRQIGALINQIESKSNQFKYQLNRAMDYSPVNNSPKENNINQAVSSFENSINLMKQNFNYRRDISGNVREVLSKANFIDRVMRDYRFNPQTENSWRVLKSDLNTLSGYYKINSDWNNYPVSNYLNGTYRLNTYQSDDVNSAIDRVLYNANYNQRDRQRTSLQRRLAVPEYLAIEKSSNYSIKMASSNANQTTFEANGRPQTEYLNNGRTMTTTATLSGDKLVINSDGDQMNAFYIAFEPFQNGQKLKVTRKLYLENRGQTITVASVYDKTSNVASWNLYRNDGYSNVNYPNNNYGNGYGFAIPNGTKFTATLNTDLSTRDIIEGQRFTMTVTSPSSYYGAVIEGTVSKASRSGRFSGNAELGLNFERIRLRNGATYRFEGLIENVITPNGKTIKVDNENGIRSGSQTKDTVVRTGIGGAIGAIIGGLTGGEKGAIIGAAIGAGAGSGSVLVQGRDDIELNNGTTFNITASSNIR
jgi:hypothetical protein